MLDRIHFSCWACQSSGNSRRCGCMKRPKTSSFIKLDESTETICGMSLGWATRVSNTAILSFLSHDFTSFNIVSLGCELLFGKGLSMLELPVLRADKIGQANIIDVTFQIPPLVRVVGFDHTETLRPSALKTNCINRT